MIKRDISEFNLITSWILVDADQSAGPGFRMFLVFELRESYVLAAPVEWNDKGNRLQVQSGAQLMRFSELSDGARFYHGTEELMFNMSADGWNDGGIA